MLKSIFIDSLFHCSTCLQPFENVIQTLQPCNHHFHTQCLEIILNNGELFCPVESCHNVYDTRIENPGLINTLVKLYEIEQNLYQKGEFNHNLTMYLAESIENNDFETAKILLEKDPKITTKLVDGCSPLYLASLAEQLEIVDILIKNGAKVNQRNNLSCHWDFNKSWFLSTPYIDSSLIGIKRSEVHLASPLNIACAKGNILLVEMLLKQEPDLDIQNANKNTPLSLAIINGHQEIASILLNAGADINIRAENGDPLIGQIVNKCYYGLLQEVLSFANDRINWNARNFNGHHILHHAVKQPDVEILNMILGTEAKNLINVSDKFSFAEFLEEFPEFINVERVEIPFSEIDEESQVTPIVLAIQEEAPKKIIEALVEAGADLTIKYNNRNLAYAVNDSYRDENDKNEVLNYLEKFKNQNGE